MHIIRGFGAAFVSLLIVTLSSCGPSSGVSSSRDIMVTRNASMFRSEAIRFVDNARRGKVDAMIHQTSRITINNEGEEKVRSIYTNKVVAAFRGKQVFWDEGFKKARDEKGNMGLSFAGRAAGEDAFRFSVDVYGESGQVVIATIRK